MTKATKTPAVKWTTKPREAAIAVLTNMAAEDSDWRWSFGDQMLILLPIGKEESPILFVDDDGKGKRYPTVKAAYGALCRAAGIETVSFDQMCTLRTTAAAWPKAQRQDPAVMRFYAHQRLNGRRADTGPAGLAEMADWIEHTVKESGKVTVKDAEKRSSDTDPSPLAEVPKKDRPKKPNPLKPFTGAKAWDNYCDALDALLKRQPRSAVPNDGISDRLTAVGSAIVAPVPTKVPTGAAV